MLQWDHDKGASALKSLSIHCAYAVYSIHTVYTTIHIWVRKGLSIPEQSQRKGLLWLNMFAR